MTAMEMAPDVVDVALIRQVFADSKTRFVLELEFVEALANPFYLQR